MRIGVIAASVLFFGLVGQPASAATFQKSSTEGCAIDLTGPIEIGDHARFTLLARLLGLFEQPNSGEPTNDADDALCLNSGGGNYFEGRIIAQELREFGIPTRIIDGAECYSSCAFIFMAGRLAGPEADTTARFLHVDGKLGFHAPYLNPDPTKKYSAAELQATVTQTNQLIADFIEFGSDISVYSGEPFIAVSLITELLATPPNEMAMVETIEDVARWRIDLFGMPEFADLDDNSLRQACVNYMAWSVDGESHVSAIEYPIEPKTSDWRGSPAEWAVVNMAGMEYQGCQIALPVDSTRGLSICSRDESNGILHGDCDAGLADWVPWYYALKPDYLIARLNDV
jgi:hypothetical protein